MSDVIIRRGVGKDVDDIVEFDKLCFHTPWSRESLLNDITENKFAFYVVAEVEGKVVGYVGIWNIVDEGHVTNVAVSPDYRRLGIASLLIESMINLCEKAGVNRQTLEVRAGNEPAKALYGKFGFKEAGVRPGYYEDNGEDAILMWRV